MRRPLLLIAAILISSMLAAQTTRPQDSGANAGQAAPAGCSTSEDAKRLLHLAIDAQGGEAALRAIDNVEIEANGYRNYLEQSERPEGPYIVEFQKITEIHDQKNQRMRHSQKGQVLSLGFSTGWATDGQVAMQDQGSGPQPGSPALLEQADELLALSPERILLTAAAASDLRCGSSERVGSIRNHVLEFRRKGVPVRVFLNPDSYLPSQVEWSGAAARSGFWNYVGDVHMTVRWTTWWLGKNGIRYPQQWDIERNGLPDSMVEIRMLKINGLDAESAKSLEIPAQIAQAYRTRGNPPDLETLPLNPDAKEIAPGVLLFPGFWNVGMVRQADGIVILEAPISSGYSARVIAEAEKRFPGQKVKAVITTSDAWPHVAGIREYAAQDIPIYAYGRNQVIVKRMLAETRAAKPDALGRNPKPADIRWVNGKTDLGGGPNRMEIYPIGGSTTERQMMVYFPEQHLLYGSDAFQQSGPANYFTPETVAEVVHAAEREKLNVSKFFMMHVGLTDWSDLAPFLAKAREKDLLPDN